MIGFRLALSYIQEGKIMKKNLIGLLFSSVLMISAVASAQEPTSELIPTTEPTIPTLPTYPTSPSPTFPLIPSSPSTSPTQGIPGRLKGSWHLDKIMCGNVEVSYERPSDIYFRFLNGAMISQASGSGHLLPLNFNGNSLIFTANGIEASFNIEFDKKELRLIYSNTIDTCQSHGMSGPEKAIFTRVNETPSLTKVESGNFDPESSYLLLPLPMNPNEPSTSSSINPNSGNSAK